MDRPGTIQLLLTAHEIDFRLAAGLRAAAGRVLVEMLPESNRIGCILLPAVVAGKFRPDVGIVLAAGAGVSLEPGATVCVRGYDGQWIEGFDAGYETPNQVRCYGAAAAFQGEIQEFPWSDSIPLQIVCEGDEFEMYATGHNVVIKRDPLIETESILWLRPEDRYRNGKATVVSIGPDAALGGVVKVGDRIVYNPAGEIDFDFGGDPDLAIITDTAVNCVYEEPI
jgi:hypothetical protein